MTDKELPGVNVSFEALILSESENAKEYARRRFYGEHYDRLFPMPASGVSGHIDRRQGLRMRLPIEELERIRDFVVTYIRLNPEQVKPYRAIFGL